jgi:hypothetical protein
MREASHDLTLTECIVRSLFLPFVHVNFWFCIDALNSVERLMQLINGGTEELYRRTIELATYLAEESSHLDGVSLSVKSVISGFIVFHVLAIKNFFVNFTNHVQFSVLIVNLKSVGSPTISYWLCSYLDLSITFAFSKGKFFPVFFACFLRQLWKMSQSIICINPNSWSIVFTLFNFFHWRIILGITNH